MVVEMVVWWYLPIFSILQVQAWNSTQHMKLPRIPRSLITLDLMITSSKASQKMTKTKNIYDAT